MKARISAVALALTLLPAAASAAEPGPASTLAVSYFDNNSGSEEWEPLKKGMADMLITDLSAISGLQIVERSRLNDVLGELDLSKSAFVDPKSAQQLGKGLAATWILVGGYFVSAETMRIDARLIRVETGEVTLTEKVEGKQEHFFAMQKELVEQLIRELGLRLSFEEKAQLRKNPTESFDAWKQYSYGLDALDKGDQAEARARFSRALTADPRYQAAKDAMGRVKVILTRHAEARDKKTDALLAGLDPDAPDFAQKVDELLRTLPNDEADGVLKRVVVLDWLVEQDLTPSSYGFSRVPMELLGFANRFTSDPDAWPLIPGVCEYVLTWYPKDQMAPATCKTLMKVIDALRGPNEDALRKRFQEDMKTAQFDWEQALYAHYDKIFALFRKCGAKAKPKAP